MKRGERSLSSRLDRIGNCLLGGQIAGTEETKTVYEKRLLERRAANQTAVVKLSARKRTDQSSFAAGDARHAALDEEARRDHSTPGGDPLEAKRRLVGTRIKMARTARDG